MQNMIIYILAEGTVGTVRDYANAQSGQLPHLVRGIEVMLRFRLFSSRGSAEPYPLEELQSVAAWQFAMDSDYTDSTAYKLEADNSAISIRSVEDGGYQYSEICVPMPHTNTEELLEWLGSAKSKSGLVSELVGFDTTGKAIFMLQIEGWTVKNRITSAGSPTVIEPDYLTAAQVRGLIAGEVGDYAPYVNVSGNWEVNGEDTGVKAQGPAGPRGIPAGFGTPVLNVTTGEPGTEASGTVTASGADTAKVFTIDLTIPEGKQGAQGPKGDPMEIDATGTAAELAQYDAEPKGFSFLATDTGMIYIKRSDIEGDWSEPVGFQGPAGKDGVTPERGVDYWTEEDISTIKSYVDEAIINGEW